MPLKVKLYVCNFRLIANSRVITYKNQFVLDFTIPIVLAAFERSLFIRNQFDLKFCIQFSLLIHLARTH